MLKNLSFGLSFVVNNVREHAAMKQMYCLNHLTDKCWLLSSALLTTLAVAVSGRERLCIPWGWGKHSFDLPWYTSTQTSLECPPPPLLGVYPQAG